MKKIPEKLKGYGHYKEIKNDMKVVVYDSLTEIEFESMWATFIDKYGLGDNEWLSGLYMERSKWVPCFLRKDFWAGMSTTQRSESINAFFDGYINSKTTLQQFVKQYSNALYDKAEKEYEADFRSLTTIIPCATNSTIERQFQQEYSHKKFNEVQAEFRGKMNCCVNSVSVDGSICHYEVMEEMCIVGRTKEVIFHIIFNRETHDVNCTCLLFEFKGIMCRHSFVILAKERVKQIPSKYILGRWSKNERRKHTYIKSGYDLKHMQPKLQRFDDLCKDFYKVAEIAAESPLATELLAQTVRSVEEKVKSVAATSHDPGPHKGTEQRQGEQTVVEDHVTVDGHSLIRSPLRVTRKGRPPFKRKMSTTERVVRKKRMAKNSHQHVVNLQESIEEDIGEECCGHVNSSVEITMTGACEQPTPVLAAIDASRNDEIYSENCWPSQLLEIDTTGFESLLTSTENDVSTGHKA